MNIVNDQDSLPIDGTFRNFFTLRHQIAPFHLPNAPQKDDAVWIVPSLVGLCFALLSLIKHKNIELE